MSAQTNAAGKADTKRARSNEANGGDADQPVEAERSVRQRTGPATSLYSADTLSAAPSAAVYASFTPVSLSFMRLAVVERQLIMQGLDLASLARLASTCRQLRGEALHREAGKFVPEPAERSSAAIVRHIFANHQAHGSPLFRAHVPVALCLPDRLTLAELQLLLIKAATFSRITELEIQSHDPAIWTEARMLQLFAQPWLQGVTHVTAGRPLWVAGDAESSSVWLQRPAVQHALFALPSLTSMTLAVAPTEPLIKTAVVQARQLSSVKIYVDPQHARSARALSVAPCLTDLSLSPNTQLAATQLPFTELIWCLPPTVQSLSVESMELFGTITPRPELKAFFQRTPRLQRLTASNMLAFPWFRGMLDAGVESLPELCLVEFSDFNSSRLTSALLRRFLHRFPKVHVHFNLSEPLNGAMMLEDYQFLHIFGGWPRVHVELPPKARPPVHHPSDDEEGSDVEAVPDPGSDPEEPEG